MESLRAVLDQLKRADADRARSARGSAEYRAASARVERLVRAVWYLARYETPPTEGQEGHEPGASDSSGPSGSEGRARPEVRRLLTTNSRHMARARRRRVREPATDSPDARERASRGRASRERGR